ncbi:MAG TPA: hypothetical protein VMM36_06805 [Opitutaceae bacterium]|nr:hypothetical protein [Opitutaceae bacterium]
MHFLTLPRPAVRRPLAGRPASQATFGSHVPFEVVVDSRLRSTGLRRPTQCAAVRLVSVDERNRTVRELQRGMTRDLWSYVRRLAREGFMERDWGFVPFAALLEGKAPSERLVLQFVPAEDDVAAAAIVAAWPQESRVAFLDKPRAAHPRAAIGETFELFAV